MSTTRTPLRTEIPESDKWDLSPLFQTDADWEADFAKLQSSFAGVAKFRGHLAESPAALAECLEFEKSIDQLVDQLNQYAALSTAGDSADATALSREAKLDGLLVKVGEAFSFISPEIQQIPDDRFAEFLADSALAIGRSRSKNSAATSLTRSRPARNASSRLAPPRCAVTRRLSPSSQMWT